jgi:type IX secretion system PorP/SprF family membrane protein
VTILKRIGLFMILILGSEGVLRAQVNNSADQVFDQFFQNYYLLNPASHDSADVLRVTIGNRSLTGLFAGVNREYVDGSLRIRHQSLNRFSRIGILVLSSHDGDFISRTRAYGRYSWTTALGARSSISAGIAAGIISYAFQGSQAGSGGTSSAFDANAGIWYMRRKLKIGFSYQQMVRSVLSPVNEKFYLSPYFNFNIIYSTDLSSFVSLSTHIYIRYQTQQPVIISVAPIFLINTIFETGVNYQYQRGFALLFGLKSIRLGKNSLRFMGSFLLSTRNLSRSSDNAFELTAGYSF